VVVVGRSGNRSLLAASKIRVMGYEDVFNLRAGLRPRNDNEPSLVDGRGEPVPFEAADEYFTAKVRLEQQGPGRR
jgi:hypothetical protein